MTRESSRKNRFGIPVMATLALALAACTTSTTSMPPLPTSPKAVAALLQKAQRMALTTMTVTYRADRWPTTRSRRSTVFVAERENDLTPGEPSQFPDLAYRQPAEAGSATTEYLAPPSRYDHWTQCQRQNDHSRWTCQFVAPGNGPQLMFNDDDWPSLLVQVLDLPFIGRAADDGYKVIDGERLPCLLFGHTTTACFFADGLIGYYSGSRPAWPVTVTLTSYSPHVAANAFLSPAKPLPWNYQVAPVGPNPLITSTAVAGAAGYFWLAGTYPCAMGKCSVLTRSTDGGGTWVRVGSVPSRSGTLVFANAEDGYSYMPGFPLFRTRDGGHTWQRVSLPDVPAQLVVTEGHAYVLLDTNYVAKAVAFSSVDSTTWKVFKLPRLPAREQVTLTAYGAKVWLVLLTGAGGKAGLMVSDNEGANFVSVPSEGMFAITCAATAASATTLWGYCTTGLMGYAVRSIDDGKSFNRLPSAVEGYSPNSDQVLPVSDRVALYQSMLTSGGWGEFVTRDGGRHFAPALLLPIMRHPVAVGYPSVALADGQSWLVLGLYSNGSQRVWRTTNGGRTWRAVELPRV